jgi:hypothetical protein
MGIGADMRKPICAYLPLEPVASRYTFDLCNKKDGWMTNTLRTAFGANSFCYGDPPMTKRDDIKTGAVLDAYTRSTYAMKQCEWVCGLIDHKLLKSGDVLYLQDFWTPGLEAILYTAHLCKVELRIYAMVHAQSVDEFDFTYDMRSWMRPIELGYANAMQGLFVASSIHKEQLRLAGVTTPIHVVSLPYNHKTVEAHYDPTPPQSTKQTAVIYSSRLDKEKNPEFMLEVAKEYLYQNTGWEWWVTTSSKEFRSYNNPEFIKKMRKFSRTNKRFRLFEGLTKQDYHDKLCRASIQFNSAKQDYVSWTLIEAIHRGCMPIYPCFRSFPECLPSQALYTPGSVSSAVNTIRRQYQGNHSPLMFQNSYRRIIEASDLGRSIIANILTSPHNPCAKEANVWESLSR